MTWEVKWSLIQKPTLVKFFDSPFISSNPLLPRRYIPCFLYRSSHSETEKQRMACSLTGRKRRRRRKKDFPFSASRYFRQKTLSSSFVQLPLKRKFRSARATGRWRGKCRWLVYVCKKLSQTYCTYVLQYFVFVRLLFFPCMKRMLGSAATFFFIYY